MLNQVYPIFKKLIFPQLCILCNKDHVMHTRNPFCFSCRANLPYTNHFKVQKNSATPKFWGKFPYVDVACLINFYSYTDVRMMMHRLKYKGRSDIGYQLGLMAGRKAKASEYFKDIDIIVPIPIHDAKLRKRGYNQSTFIGNGIGEVLDIAVREDVIIKKFNTESQTQKSRIERVKNVMSSFSLEDKNGIQGRHVLIVDDVLTTGATIEACANLLLEARGVKISVMSICLARN